MASALSSLVLNCNDTALKEEWLSAVGGNNKVSDPVPFNDISQNAMENHLEKQIRKALSHQEEERKKEMAEKKKRKSQSRKLANFPASSQDCKDSESIVSTRYDLENFMRHEESIENGDDMIENDGKQKCLLEFRTDTELSDDMKSTFSQQSSDTHSIDDIVEVSTSKQDDTNNRCLVEFSTDVELSDDMKSTFSQQSSVKYSVSKNVEECTSKQVDDFEEDDWW